MINVQQRNADEQQRSVAARSKKTQEEEVQCKRLADAAMRDLASAMPALEEAVKVRQVARVTQSERERERQSRLVVRYWKHVLMEKREKAVS